MYSENELCERITAIYPEVGQCGRDIRVDYSAAQGTWVVHLKKGSHTLDHYLESMDADPCMEGKQCVALGLEIAQLKSNIEGKQF